MADEQELAARSSTVTNGAAISRAREELERTRDEFERARAALLDVLTAEKPVSVREVVTAVQTVTDLDTSRIQQALWALVREHLVRLGDEFAVNRVADR